jgi:primosomal protein N' (replication factor Y)
MSAAPRAAENNSAHRKGPTLYAEVVFNRPIPPLTYEVGDDLDIPRTFGTKDGRPREGGSPENGRRLLPGMRVSAPLRQSTAQGIVTRLLESTDLTGVKPIREVLDSEPVINADLMETAEWMSRYYLCSLGEALWTIVPKGIKKREKIVLRHDETLEDRELVLTPDQQRVFGQVADALDRNEGGRFLLHGVTGSGKTEIYLRVIHEAVKRGLGAILLVPEISLTPQTVAYFSARLGHELALLHSRLTKAEKINEWHRILSGKRRIAIGARSAVFAPLEKIGIIIIDEEHETSYKSDETPRYSARSIAAHRAARHGAVLLLGSATPSVESYYLAKEQKMHLLELPKRVENQQLPATRISDLKQARELRFLGKPLLKAVEDRLRKREQVILFLNRRGFSPHVHCPNCGHVFSCSNCDITLTFHRKTGRLICHYCGYNEPPPEVCPMCGDERLEFAGFGTEKIEAVVSDHFPGAVIVRMDTDTVKKRTAVSEILQGFAKGHIDILIGTQIVSKGLHFPNVTLVGVVNADIALNFPDFRSAERTFNLITQVSGRAGRGSKGGEVIIQTYNPSHYAIQTAKLQDYQEFFIKEISHRKALLYPPFCRIVRLVFRGPEEGRVLNAAEEVLRFIEGQNPPVLSILGPSLCPLSRIKNNYRAHLIIKTGKVGPVLGLLETARDLMRKQREVYLEIDVDPMSML